jgi:hypothetical protein
LRLRLARAQVLNCQLDQPLSLAQRRNAKPAEQPYVACGSAVRPRWKLPSGADSAGFGLQLVAAIDTTTAGFRTPPCYSAHLLGGREFTFSVGDKIVKRVLDGFVLIIAPSESGFEFSLFVPDSLLTKVPEQASDPDPRKDATFSEQLLTQIDKNEWRVDWIGVEG